MVLKKIKVRNFKKFKSGEFEFNDDVNMLVGDNESGKSTLLEAIELVLNGCYRGKPLRSEITTDLFNSDCVEGYLSGSKKLDTLPELLIEAYIDGNPKLKGENNTDEADREGIFLRIFFDPDLSDAYAALVRDPSKITTLPVELYTYEWFSFAWERITQHNKAINCLFVDATRIHPTYGRTQYINSIVSAAISKADRATLNLNYRQLKGRFDNEEDVQKINADLNDDNEITDKSLNVTANIASTTSWESSLHLTVDDVSFDQIGKGEQNQIQIKLAIHNKAQNVDILMIEEPENHLAHINLVRLVSTLEKRSAGKQLFITTHSSYVLNKLSIDKLCLLSKNYIRLKDIDNRTAKYLKRLPGYDTLRVILAQRVILVEGPSDELVLKKIYLENHDILPEEDGIDVIVVRGVGFGHYLNLTKPLGHSVRVVRDNDGDYQTNVQDWFKEFKDEFTKCFSPNEDQQYSLEPALIAANGTSIESLNCLARVMLSKTTYTKYDAGTLEERKSFLLKWYKGIGKNSGSRKVYSALRIFDSDKKIEFPRYLKDAVEFNE